MKYIRHKEDGVYIIPLQLCMATVAKKLFGPEAVHEVISGGYLNLGILKPVPMGRSISLNLDPLPDDVDVMIKQFTKITKLSDEIDKKDIGKLIDDVDSLKIENLTLKKEVKELKRRNRND